MLIMYVFFFLSTLRTPRSTRTYARFTYTTPVRSEMDKKLAAPATAETAALAPAVTRTTTTTAPARKPAEKPAADKSDASRLALVKTVEVPATGNEVEDASTYGYRLWDAKLYPEPEAQLKRGNRTRRVEGKR